MRDRSPSHAMPSPQHPRSSTQPAASRDRTDLRNAEAGRLSGIGVTQKQSEHEEREDEDKGENNRTHGGASFQRPRKNQVHSESITEPAEGRIRPRSSRYPYSRGANRGSVTLAGHIIRVCRSPLLHDGVSRRVVNHRDTASARTAKSVISVTAGRGNRLAAHTSSSASSNPLDNSSSRSTADTRSGSDIAPTSSTNSVKITPGSRRTVGHQLSISDPAGVFTELVETLSDRACRFRVYLSYRTATFEFSHNNCR